MRRSAKPAKLISSPASPSPEAEPKRFLSALVVQVGEAGYLLHLRVVVLGGGGVLGVDAREEAHIGSCSRHYTLDIFVH